MSFTPAQIQQIEDKGLTVEGVLKQIDVFKLGLPKINLKSVATLDEGVFKFSTEEEQYFLEYYESQKEQLDILKFVPASGAATRMFKFLFDFLQKYNPEKQSINGYINKYKVSDLLVFGVGIEKFPFYKNVVEETKKYTPDFDKLSVDEKAIEFIKTMLSEVRLNYGMLPKGLFPFHKYKEHIATAFEEHLFGGAQYAASKNVAKLHFTIYETHRPIFDEEFKRIKAIVERKTNTTFDISFSYQKEITDTIAVTLDNEPFINSDGSLLFRPSGHGALLSNLNEFETDIIFIKNVDNVVVYKYEQEVARYKKVLAGVLLETQNKAFEYLKALENDTVEETERAVIVKFLETKLNIIMSPEYRKYSAKYQKEYLVNKLNRPIRVCGMVKNEDEPGGGPFWVKDENNTISLQIVESGQIDKKNEKQKNILENATHFNPVDLVCGIRDYKGETFDLLKFVDDNTGFITRKTKAGIDLKALELPGLWNGSMANWNTIFVEVPLVTFNPVKNVNDLLKAAHQVG